MKTLELKIAIIGATGNVGRIVISKILNEQLVLPKNLTLFASTKSAGSNLKIDNHEFIINDATKTDFSGFTICIFNTESDISEQLIPIALNSGSYVIDSSSHYRMANHVPLIVPPVNIDLVQSKNKLYAHANCITSPISTVISPLDKINPIETLHIVTFQSTSGAGKTASDECWSETESIINKKNYERTFFKKQIAFNVIPQIGEIQTFESSEEDKIINEIHKVVNPKISINATAIRVPVIQGHSAAIYVRFKNIIDIIELNEIIRKSPSIIFNSELATGYSTPIEVIGKDEVFVGRVRPNKFDLGHGYNLWLCADNLRRGAAADSVEILKAIIDLL